MPPQRRPLGPFLTWLARAAAFSIDFLESAVLLVRVAAFAVRRRHWEGLWLCATEPFFVMAIASLGKAGYMPSILTIYDPNTPRDAAERQLAALHANVCRAADEATAALAARRGGTDPT